MNIKRFFATSSREVLNMVRNELGSDAVIVSNRSSNGGNEILAVRGSDMQHLIDNKSAPATAEPTPTHQQMSEAQAKTLEHTKTEEIVTLLTSKRLPADNAANDRQPSALNAPQPGAISRQTSEEMHSVMQEIREMRADIDSQLTETFWLNQQRRDPAKKLLLKTMLKAGFSAGLSRRMVENMPANSSAITAMDWAKTIISRNLKSVDDESELLDKGGIFALVGPTGVGKTTTTAKLAARFVMQHGASKIALITTDAYRIGGQEQLRTYGNILGVMVHAVKDEADLQIALQELKHKHTILIDTVGVSQRDRMVAQQIAMLSGKNNQIKKILCLNASNTIETLNDVVHAYRGNGSSGHDLDGCIITKIDEAATIGSVLDVVIQQKLKMFYLTNGQRVPEDIHLVNKNWLLHHTFNAKLSPQQPSDFNDDELPFVIANHASMHNPEALEISHA